MCTVSWVHESDGYQLFCNRDERLTRSAAMSPRLHRREGVRFLAPVDGDFGGTWIASNEFGVSLCVLNGPVRKGRSEYRSRGLVLLDLIAARSLAEMADRFLGTDLSVYKPFVLVALAAGQPALLLRWDGDMPELADGDAFMPLCSSSFDPQNVQILRRRQLETMVESAGRLHAGVLLAFHRSHRPYAGAYSPCMHRRDAETVSFTWVTVRNSVAEYFYEAGPPCRSFAGESRTLALQREEKGACLACCG